MDAMIYENIDITVKKVRLQKKFGKNAQNAAKYLAMSKKSSTFAPSNEKTTIMDNKKTNGETSKAWEASRATQGNVIVLDPKYM
ncbi:MAG: hypothetical protein J6T32_03780 [Paludibacteraceae bacterium]|nr:hypothetical protein [Paludibacteraceae bacterium]